MKKTIFGCAILLTTTCSLASTPDSDFDVVSKNLEMTAPNPNGNCQAEIKQVLYKKSSRNALHRIQPGISDRRVDFALTSQALWFDVRAFDKEWFYKMWGKTDLIAKYQNIWVMHCDKNNGTVRQSTKFAIKQMTATHHKGVSWQVSEMPDDISTVMATASKVKQGETAGVNAGFICGQRNVFITAFKVNPYNSNRGILEAKFDNGDWKKFDVAIEQPGLVIITDESKTKTIIHSMKRGSSMKVRPYSPLSESIHVATYDLKGFTKAFNNSKNCR